MTGKRPAGQDKMDDEENDGMDSPNEIRNHPTYGDIETED
jgi:hypothetical protein